MSRSRGPGPAASLPGAPAPGGRECCPAADSSHAAGTVNKDVFPRVAAATAGPASAAAAGCGISGAEAPEGAEGRAGPAAGPGPDPAEAKVEAVRGRGASAAGRR